jgi:hypothetical protein
MKMIEAPGWSFTKDQWEPEMWAKVFRKIEEKDFIYCTHTIPRADYCVIPGSCGLDFLREETERPAAESVREMVENALCAAVAGFRNRGIEPAVAFIREGPYTIPYLAPGKAEGR